MKLQDSETYKNLQTAFIGECAAHCKYVIYAGLAKEEGYGYLADIFVETAGNEKEHGEQWLKLLREGQEKDIYSNLLDCVKSEHYENSTMYKNFAKKAREEGFISIAEEFERVGGVEFYHETRYQLLANLLDNEELYHSNKDIIWKCSACGYEYKGQGAPLHCPLCGHDQGFYYPKKQLYF